MELGKIIPKSGVDEDYDKVQVKFWVNYAQWLSRNLTVCKAPIHIDRPIKQINSTHILCLLH